MPTEFLAYDESNCRGKVGRRGILANIDCGDRCDVCQPPKLRIDATSLQSLKGSTVRDYVGDTFQALFANESLKGIHALQYP